MSSTVEPMDFLFLAGHPVLDFLNTRPVVKGKAIEQLGTLEEFTRWLIRAGRIDA